MSMSKPYRSLLFLLILAVFSNLAATPVPAADDWLPIPDEDRSLTDLKEQPGAHAVLLYRKVHTDDVNSVERHYYRIKILTEEGKGRGDIEIPYVKGFSKVKRIKARTVQPDGAIVPFEGKVFDKLVVKVSGVKVQSKTFSFPEVQVGSILEYRYRVTWDNRSLRAPTWNVQDTLFTREAHFSFKPYPRIDLSWVSRFLPEGVNVAEGKKKVIELNIDNVPAFEEERYMPPESSLRTRVNFFYFRRNPKSVDDYWVNEGKDWNGIVKQFINKKKDAQRALAGIVAAGDSEDEKVQKIYTYVQGLRNLSYERSRTKEERKREKIKTNNHIGDVLKRGYGYRTQLTRLFVALARAADMEADVVRVSERDVQFFMKNLLSWRQLDGEVAVVKVNGEDRWFDPGTPYCPEGMLSWHRTGVAGIRLAKDGGTFVQTPLPQSTDAIVHRKANLKLDDTGTLEGTLTVTFHGMEAIRRRLSALEDDETTAQEELEEEIKGWLPSNATLKLEEVTGLESSEEPLQAVVKITLPGFAASTGRRLLLPTGVFVANTTNPFRHAKRVHPVYFRSPFQRLDQLSIELPGQIAVESLPETHTLSPQFGHYAFKAWEEEGKLQIQRQFVMEGYFFRTAFYPVLKDFYGRVRTNDEEQAVLRMAPESNDD
jgi:hypothetical protein